MIRRRIKPIKENPNAAHDDADAHDGAGADVNIVERFDKSIFTAYFLWLIGGIFGWHHLYLNRHAQAFVWGTSFGGFYFGWILDFFKLPSYVDAANWNKTYIDKLKIEMRDWDRPPVHKTGIILQVFYGLVWYILIRNILPMDILSPFVVPFLGPIGAFIGVSIVGYIVQRGNHWYTLLAALIVEVIPFLCFGRRLYGVSILVAVFVSTYSRRWKALPSTHLKRRSCCMTSIKHVILLSAFFGLILCAIYFNASVPFSEEPITVQETVHNFFESPFWRNIKPNLLDFWLNIKNNDWNYFWQNFLNSLDLEGEKHAYSVLDLPYDTNFSDVRVKYRSLARQWHPDRNPGNESEAELKFMEIQNAYEIIHTIHSRRTKTNSHCKGRGGTK